MVSQMSKHHLYLYMRVFKWAIFPLCTLTILAYFQCATILIALFVLKKKKEIKIHTEDEIMDIHIRIHSDKRIHRGGKRREMLCNKLSNLIKHTVHIQVAIIDGLVGIIEAKDAGLMVYTCNFGEQWQKVHVI